MASFSGKSLVDAIKSNREILMITGIGFVTAMVLYLIIGIFAGLVADGTISVPTDINTTIQAFATTAGTVFTTILAVFGTIAGFVIIVAMLQAFGIKLDMGGKKEDF